jgi:hypothetical protein
MASINRKGKGWSSVFRGTPGGRPRCPLDRGPTSAARRPRFGRCPRGRADDRDRAHDPGIRRIGPTPIRSWWSSTMRGIVPPSTLNYRMDVANDGEFLRSRAFPMHAALDEVFVAVGWRNVRWISIEIGSPNAILRPVLVDPLPQQVRCDPSFSTRRALGAHDIGCKPVSIAAAPAAAMI